MARSPFADFTARYDPGDIVFRAGEPGSTLFVVQSGAVQLVTGEDGAETVLAVMEKGDFFGEMSLLEGTPRNVTARASDAAVLIEISSALFDRMIRSNIELAVRMLRKLSLRLAEAESRAGAPVRPGPHPEVPDPSPPQPPSPPEIPAPVSAAAGPAVLLIPGSKEMFRLEADTARVGRFDPVTGTRPEIDLTLLDLKRSVSRRHAVFVRDDEGFLLSEEVGALNGTHVNGRALSPGEPVRLRHGDEVSFGGVVLKFRIGRPSEAA